MVLCEDCGGEFRSIPLLEGTPICRDCIKEYDTDWETEHVEMAAHVVRNVYGELSTVQAVWVR